MKTIKKSGMIRNSVIILSSSVLLWPGCAGDTNAQLSTEAQNNISVTEQAFDPTETPLAPEPDSVSAKKIKVALLLDTSNSMDGLIEQAKSQLWKIVNELSSARCGDGKPELEIALYEYGNDRLTAMENYIRLVTPLTNDLDKISDDLFKLTTMGGSEFCGAVIQSSTRQLDWVTNGDHLQLIFICGNEPFTQGAVNYREACLAAKQKGIVINTIFCGSFNEGINTMWKEGADLTGGSYMSIEQDRKTVYIDTPYDQQLGQLNITLNNTYIYYGKTGYEKKMNQEKQDKNADSYGLANSSYRIASKASGFYKNAMWDLVDASYEKDYDLSKIKDEDLPKELRGKTLAEKEKIVLEKRKEREVVKAQINALNKKRMEYIAEKEKTTVQSSSLDAAMISAIRTQAKSRNFIFEK